MEIVRRGDIFLGEVDGVGGVRPLVIVSDTKYNKTNSTILVAPILTLKPGRKISSTILIEGSYYGLSYTSVIHADKISSISNQRLIKKIARLNNEDLERLLKAIGQLFEIKKETQKVDTIKVFKDMTINGYDTNLNDFKVYLLNTFSNNDFDSWELEKYEQKSDFIVFRRNEFEGKTGAMLFLQIKNKPFSVSNIIPTSKISLSFDEYNEIIDEFRELFVQPYILINPGRIKVDTTSQNAHLEDFLTNNVSHKLKVFSSEANKSTGTSHPSDKKRWFEFLTISYYEDQIISSEFLYRWLVEADNWPEDTARELAIDYENSIELLKYFNERYNHE